jgi:hypothetical protein
MKCLLTSDDHAVEGGSALTQPVARESQLVRYARIFLKLASKTAEVQD